MPLDLMVDLAHALDPVGFAEDRLDFRPDPWQAQLLRSTAPWILLNCCRQSGKSTTTAILALHTALYDPRLILKDEAAYVSDDMQAALDPMLALSSGRLVEMSSPAGRRGHFFENWQHAEGVERIRIIGRNCPRISVEFLEQQRRKLGP